VLDKLIKRVELLSHQTLLLEEGADDDPRVLLRLYEFRALRGQSLDPSARANERLHHPNASSFRFPPPHTPRATPQTSLHPSPIDRWNASARTSETIECSFKGRDAGADLHLRAPIFMRFRPAAPWLFIETTTRAYLTNLFLLFLHVDVGADRVLVVVHAHRVRTRDGTDDVCGRAPPSGLGNGSIEHSDMWRFMYTRDFFFGLMRLKLVKYDLK
jgi:hypothetical protein